jgi:hypothetical protein
VSGSMLSVIKLSVEMLNVVKLRDFNFDQYYYIIMLFVITLSMRNT